MKITHQDVEHAAVLSRLDISNAQINEYQNTLNNILKYVHRLNEVDTRQVESTTHVLPLKNVMRPDEVIPSMPRELALANSPEQEDGYIKVAKIMES